MEVLDETSCSFFALKNLILYKKIFLCIVEKRYIKKEYRLSVVFSIHFDGGREHPDKKTRRLGGVM